MSTNETSVTARPREATPQAVAPVWHTIVFLVIILGLAALSAHSQAQMVQQHGRIPAYATTFVVEWALTGYVVWGLRRGGRRLRDIIGGRWRTPEDFLLDVAIAVGFWIVAAALLAGLSFLLGLARPEQMAEAKRTIGALLPRSGLELVLWLGLSATAGFCEEVMFRGYLQAQCAALTRNVFAGVALQALIFGAGHAYQGVRHVPVIITYGFFFGLLAWQRRSLRPGMIAHTLQDSFSGLMAGVLRRM